MAYINTRVSDCVSPGFAGGPEWQTEIVQLDNGREQRNANWLYPRHRYSAQFNNFSRADQASVIALFHAARGQLHAFRFKDWNDWQAVSEVITPVAGTTTPVQLLKSYTFGSETASRLVQAPVAGTVTVYRNGVSVAGTLDATTGLFTPSANWAATGTFTWSGEFDVWVRFASDFNAFTANTNNYASADIELIEVRR